MEQNSQLISHLFRQEFAKMVSVISKLFGLQYIEIAEDIVGETFLLATEQWTNKATPANPTAWLYTVAKNKTLEYLNRNKLFSQTISPVLKRVETTQPDVDFSIENIKDSQLQMMFAVCNPAIAAEAQIGLALRVLCGFSIDEIAEAFFTNKETINKRLFRAKQKLKDENIPLELPAEKEIEQRLDNVLHIIYLLFNEGYYSRVQNNVLRKDLCLEAMCLGVMLIEYTRTNTPQTNALMALMCYHASRFDARVDAYNVPVLYENQNIELWDNDLISEGNRFLHLSAQGNVISIYHLEARIAYWHCYKEDTPIKWESVLDLYNKLLQINYSPALALNRTYALYKAKGVEAALQEALKLELDDNHFYYALLGELYKTIDKKKAMECLQEAYHLTKSDAEKKVMRDKMEKLSMP